jgi:peptidoglycan/LPS O-acetylase OafA/YrhL
MAGSHADATRAPAGGGGGARAHRVLALAFLAGAVAQFFLAGLAAFGGTDWKPHQYWGTALTAVALVLVILAGVGRRAAMQASAVLLGLMVLQNLLAGFGTDVPVLGAVHPVVGLMVLGTAMLAAAGRPVRFGPPHRA